jgi:hypothetical protein
MRGDYHSHRRYYRYRPELVALVAMLGLLLIVVVVACVSWALPDEPTASYVPIESEKPSRLDKFIHGMKRAVKDAATDDQN